MRFHPLTVKEIRPETADAYTVAFDRPDDPAFDYLPGQYLTLKLNVNGEELRRAYSLSSCPKETGELAITVKRVQDGRASNYLADSLKAGEALEVYPPMGKFVVECQEANAKHYILIGAGSGITPLMSILKTVLQEEPRSKVTLVYGNTNEDCIIFKEALERLEAEHHGRLQVVHVLSRPEGPWSGATGRIEGRIAYDILAEVIQQDKDLKKNFYLCGPSGMMESAIDVLEMLSVAPSLIHREYYSAPVETPEEDGYESLDPDDIEIVTQEVEVILGWQKLSGYRDA